MAMRRDGKPVVWQKKQNSLFRGGPNFQMNACVGWNGGPPDFGHYARGYFAAGELLVKGLEENRRHVDSVIYPLVQVYRHGFELILKHIGEMLPALCEGEAEIKLNHNLLHNWEIVRRCLAKLEFHKSDLDFAEHTLNELVEFDPNGQTFRYPTAKDGTIHLEETSLINVEAFAEPCMELVQYLEFCSDMVAEMVQTNHEMERYMADYHGY